MKRAIILILCCSLISATMCSCNLDMARMKSRERAAEKYDEAFNDGVETTIFNLLDCAQYDYKLYVDSDDIIDEEVHISEYYSLKELLEAFLKENGYSEYLE